MIVFLFLTTSIIGIYVPISNGTFISLIGLYSPILSGLSDWIFFQSVLDWIFSLRSFYSLLFLVISPCTLLVVIECVHTFWFQKFSIFQLIGNCNHCFKNSHFEEVFQNEVSWIVSNVMNFASRIKVIFDTIN